MKKWESVQEQIESLAKSNQLLPFLGAAISYFQPTNLPLGKGLLHAALQGIFPCRKLFVADEYNWTLDEVALDRHSPEVIFQGLAEGLVDREKLASIHNRMDEIPYNPLHKVLATALLNGNVPAIFTTNQDHCIEDAGGGHLSIIYGKQDFTFGFRQGLFQFHGAIGGITPEEIAERRKSLTFTLNAMGPHLTSEHDVLEEAIKKYTLLFLGYSGSDPDIWYSLSEILEDQPNIRIYWCVKDVPSSHLLRLQSQHPNSIVLFQGDIVEILKTLSAVWGIEEPGTILIPNKQMLRQRLKTIRGWAMGLTTDERDLAYSWLLVSVGQHRRACEELVGTDGKGGLLARSKSNQDIHMLAALFAGYAKREMSDHKDARKYLRMAEKESEGHDSVRHAQAIHKLGESLSTFESVRFWYFWPTIPKLHEGAQWLLKAIDEYDKLGPEKLAAKQIGRAGRGSAIMNQGQLYRRTAAYTPYIRPKLAQKARTTIEDSLKILRDEEKDLRVLPMAVAAIGADDPTKTLAEKKAEVDKAIEYAEEWNKDEIQIGSAYFMKAQLLAKEEPSTSEACYSKALASFKAVGMKAEIARTEIELAAFEARQAAQTIHDTQGSLEWKFLFRMLGVAKILFRLAPIETILAIVLLITLIGALIVNWNR